MAALNEVDVVLKQSTLTAKAAKPNQPRTNVEKKKEMVKLGNTQVNRGSKNVSLRRLFNGLSKEMYHLRKVKLYSESAELVPTCAAV